MTHQKISLSKTPHSGQWKSFRNRAALILATLILAVTAATTLATAQTYTTLHTFDGTDGAYPWSPLVQAANGELYGTASSGGVDSFGTTFKIAPNDTLTTLYSFCWGQSCINGLPTLVEGTDRNLWGTTAGGGTASGGTVFTVTPEGTLTVIYNFPCGIYSQGCLSAFGPWGLIQATDGDFYGAALSGGANGNGAIFKITPSGAMTTLSSFCSQKGCPNFREAVGSPVQLLQASDGDFYGTSPEGGTNNSGTVFRVTPSGVLTTLYSFCSQSDCTDGSTPQGVLIQGADGNLYGTTVRGGLQCGYFDCGTIFKISMNGSLTTLYSFCPQEVCADGTGPLAGLVQGTDGNFYGTTLSGGANNVGTIFKITPGGTLTVLYNFCSAQGPCKNGGSGGVITALVQATSGIFYGARYDDGFDDGTLFSLDVGLRPFVRLVSTSGTVGTPITIQGQGLTGTTAVSFNGTPATFKVWADTFLKATVPSGAKTGPVRVTTPTGTLTSNHEFRVHPEILAVTPASGAAGTPIVITGTSFTQTTKVTFGGGKAAATFTVDSDTQVTATVPARAPAGYIVLTTAGGRSRSPDSFTVTP